MESFDHCERRRVAWAVGLLVLATLLVFGRVLGHDFVSWDDPVCVTQNPHLNPPSAAGLWNLWTAPYEGMYVPLSYTWFALAAWCGWTPGAEEAAASVDPALFHAGSLAFHLLSVLGVFVLLRQLVRHTGAACAGALLFALHPLQVESVVWISDTRTPLSTLFALLALSQYVRFAESASAADGRSGTRDRGARERTRRWLHYAAGMAALVLALLAKPTAAAVPLMAAVLDLAWLKRRWQETAKALAPWIVLAAGFGLVTSMEQPADQMPFVAPLWARPFIACDALTFYLGKLVWPVGLGMHYDRSPERVMHAWWFWVSWIMPAGTVAGLAVRRLRPLGVTVGVLFLAGALPTLGLTPFLFQRYSTVADRYVYLAMLGPALAAAAWLAARWSPARATVVGAVLIVWGGLSWVQAGFWRDSETLYEHALGVNPASFLAHNNLGILLAERGERDRAEEHLLKALCLKPDYAEAAYNLGFTREGAGRPDEALALYRRAVGIAPHYRQAWTNAARLLEQCGDDDALVHELGEAVRLNPGFWPVRNVLAATLARQGRVAEAITHWRKSLEAQPGQPLAANDLALLLAGEGKTEAAADLWLRAIELDRHLVEPYTNLGVVRFRQGRLDEALRLHRQALELDPRHAAAHANLANVLASQGDLGGAERQYLEALSIDPHLETARRNLATVREIERKQVRAAATPARSGH